MKIFNPLYLLSLSASGFNRPASNRALSPHSTLTTSQNKNPFVFSQSATQYPQCDFSLATVPPYPQCDARSTPATTFNSLLRSTEHHTDKSSWHDTLGTVIDRIDSTMTTAEKTADKATYALLIGAGVFALLRLLAAKLGLVPNHNQGQAAHHPAHARARG